MHQGNGPRKTDTTKEHYTVRKLYQLALDRGHADVKLDACGHKEYHALANLTVYPLIPLPGTGPCPSLLIHH